MPSTSKIPTITEKSSISAIVRHMGAIAAVYAKATHDPDSFYPDESEETRQHNWLALQTRFTAARDMLAAKKSARAADIRAAERTAAHNTFTALNDLRALAVYPYIELGLLRSRVLSLIDDARLDAKQMATNQELLTDPALMTTLAENIIRAVTDSLERMNQHAERCATYNHEKESTHD